VGLGGHLKVGQPLWVSLFPCTLLHFGYRDPVLVFPTFPAIRDLGLSSLVILLCPRVAVSLPLSLVATHPPFWLFISVIYSSVTFPNVPKFLRRQFPDASATFVDLCFLLVVFSDLYVSM